MSKKKKNKFSIFWVFYALLLLGMIGFWVYFLKGVIAKDLKIYERSERE